MATIRILSGFAAVVWLGLSVPAAAVSGSVDFEYRNSRSGQIETQSTLVTPGGVTASFAFAEATVSGAASTGLAQVTSSLAIDTRGPKDQNFLDSIGYSSASHNIMVANAPASAGFLEIAFVYRNDFNSTLSRLPGSLISGETISGMVYHTQRSVNTFTDGYYEVSYETRNGFTFPVYTYIPDFRFFGVTSKLSVYDQMGTYNTPDTLLRIYFNKSGFESGQVLRIPFLTGRNMSITLSSFCHVRTDDQRQGYAAGTCSQSFGWGGLLGAVDMDGNAIPLDQIDLLGSKPFFGDAVPLDFDPYANLSGIAFTPIPVPTTGAVPEPASWALLIAGFGLIGGVQRRARRAVHTAW